MAGELSDYLMLPISVSRCLSVSLPICLIPDTVCFSLLIFSPLTRCWCLAQRCVAVPNPNAVLQCLTLTLCCSAVSNNIINLRKRHPRVDRPLVDYEFALSMGPPTMAGAIVGTIVHKVPRTLVVCLTCWSKHHSI